MEIYPKTNFILTTTILEHDISVDKAIDEVASCFSSPLVHRFYYSKNGCGSKGHVRISEADANFIHSAITRISNNRGNFSALSVEEQSKFADIIGCRGIDLSHLSKAEYKKLMLKFHPDKYESQGGNDFAETIYKFIGEAYRDSVKKAAA